uniref:BZIP domain-containing protein n=1 Tax=Steinernema glaseri TaxID=37863 RepID=A0A1I8A866_9BILA
MAASRFLRNGKPALGVFDETEKDGDLDEDEELDETTVNSCVREASVLDDESTHAGKDLFCRTEAYKRTPEDSAPASDQPSRIKPLHVNESVKKNLVAFIKRKRKQEEEAAQQRTAMKKKKEDAEEKVRNARKDVEQCDEELKRLNQKIDTLQKQHHEMTTQYKTLYNKQKAAEAAKAEADARKTAEAQAAQAAQYAQAQAQAAQLSAALESRNALQQRASPFANPAAAAASLANKAGLSHLGAGIDPSLLLQLYANANRSGLGFQGLIPNTNPSSQP